MLNVAFNITRHIAMALSWNFTERVTLRERNIIHQYSLSREKKTKNKIITVTSMQQLYMLVN